MAELLSFIEARRLGKQHKEQSPTARQISDSGPSNGYRASGLVLRP
jgi:hypothetical protein